MLLLGFAGAVRLEELVDAAGQVAQDARGAFELLVKHHAGLPIHGAPQVVGQLEGILPEATRNRRRSCSFTRQGKGRSQTRSRYRLVARAHILRRFPISVPYRASHLSRPGNMFSEVVPVGQSETGHMATEYACQHASCLYTQKLRLSTKVCRRMHAALFLSVRSAPLSTPGGVRCRCAASTPSGLWSKTRPSGR